MQSASDASRRIYVDDLTFWSRGADGAVGESVADALAATKRFEAAMDWQLNSAKSRLWANARVLR
eukprot:5491765-Lingulodinium_polyedra.AAC.1